MAQDKLSPKVVLQELSSEQNGFKYMIDDAGPGLGEKVASLFQPDILLPAQYFETFRRKAHLEPEKRLMLAVLEDSVACFQKYISARDAKGKTVFHEAEEWILEEDSEWLFSFENICEVLGFNPQYVRQGLMRWKENELAERPKAKIYRWTARVAQNKPGLEMSGRTEERLLKAAGR